MRINNSQDWNSGQETAFKSFFSKIPEKTARVGVIGTSLVQQNDVATSSKISHWNRGWLSWARFFAKGRFECVIWSDNRVYSGWEPSQVSGTSRNFRGLNAGVSGQTSSLINDRKSFLVDNVDCDIIIIDSGTNDMAVLSKEEILQYRESLANYYLSKGVVVIFLPILSRAVTSWAAGSSERQKAAWLNQKTREFCNKTSNCFLFDWNSTWVDCSNSNGEPLVGYSNDGIHFSPKGGVAVGEALSNFLSSFLPNPQPRVWSPDDKFNLVNNPLGNILSNPFCTGTSGTIGTGVTGSVATGMRVERSSGTATVVASKETRSDGRGDYQVMTITAGASDSLIYFRTSSADTTHNLSAGDWVQASVEIDIGDYSGWQGVSLYLKDNGSSGLISYGLEAFDDGAGYITLPARQMNGLITTPAIQISSGSPSLRWRLEVRTAANAAGTGVIKVGAVELRKVEDPRKVVNYRGE